MIDSNAASVHLIKLTSEMKGFKVAKLFKCFSSRWVGKVVAKWVSKLDAFIITLVAIYGYNLSIKVFMWVGGWMGTLY